MSAVNTINAVVDLSKGVQMVRLGRLFAANDKAAHTINVRVLDNGAVADLTGQTISAYFIRPDNATVTIQGTLSGNVASITLPSSCYANSGHFSLIIKAVSTNTTTAIFWCDGTITRSTTDTIVDPENVIPSLEELLAQIEVMEQGTAAANSAAESANTAASAANSAATSATSASSSIQNITVSAATATPGNPSAVVSTVDGHKHIDFGIPAGVTPNLTIGTVTTLSEESDATATITGTIEAPVLNLGIPKGRTGSAENVFASNVPMSTTDSTTIYEKLEDVDDDISALQTQVVDIAHGGTNATTEADARINLQVIKTNMTDDSMQTVFSGATDPQLLLGWYGDADNRYDIVGDSTGVYVHQKDNGTWTTVPQSISKGGTGGKTALEARQKLGLDYVAGETETQSTAVNLPAYISSSNTVVDITIQPKKMLNAVSTITFTSLRLLMRGVDGYLDSNSALTQFVGRSGYTITATKVGTNYINVRVTKSSAFGNSTNNTPVTVRADWTFRVS